MSPICTLLKSNTLVKSLGCTALLAVLATTAGCDAGSAPDKSWEVAVKGTYSAALSEDGRLAVVGSITHGGSLWETARGERLYNWNHRQGEYSNIIACGFSPDSRFALTADHQTMVLWNTETGKSLTFWTAPSEVHSIDLTPNGNYALLGLGDFSVVLFDVKRGGIERSFYHENRVRSVALSDDGRLAVSGSDDQTAKLWDLQAGKALFTWQHNAEVLTVAISPGGDRALTVAKYDKAVVWNTATGKPVGELPLSSTAIKRGQSFVSAAFSADGRQLLTGNSDRLVQLWSVADMSLVAEWTLPKRDAWKPTGAAVVAVSFGAQDKQYYAIASNGFLHRLRR